MTDNLTKFLVLIALSATLLVLNSLIKDPRLLSNRILKTTSFYAMLVTLAGAACFAVMLVLS